MDFGTILERGDFTAWASRRDGCFNPKCLLAEPAANGKPATYSHTRQRPSWVESGVVRRQPSIARPSHRMCVVSQLLCVGRLHPSQIMCAGNGHLLRVGP